MNNHPDPHKTHCPHCERLVKKLKLLDVENKLNFEKIDQAIYWARKYHASQRRKSGEPFYTHPIEVAYKVADFILSTDIVVASILHDVVEDTEVTAGMILDEFGWRAAKMVDMLTRDRPDDSKLTVEQILYNACMQYDKEVLIIKLLDRMHNMETINAKPQHKIDKTVNETLRHFILLAEFLELPHIAKEMHDICMKSHSDYKDRNNIDDIYQYSFVTDTFLPPFPYPRNKK